MKNRPFLPLLQISTFIIQNEIVDGVKEAFASKVDDSMLNWLIGKATYQKKKNLNNNSAWINLIPLLDSSNLTILMKHIEEKQDYLLKDIEFSKQFLSEQ